MYVLLIISDPLVKTLDEIIEKFLWNSCHPKISKNTLQLPKEKGRLGLIDFRAKDKAIKCTWPQLLEKDWKLAEIVYSIIVPELKELIWMCDLSPKDTHYIIDQTVHRFWYDTLQSWFEWKSVSNFGKGTPCDMIWYKSNIRIEGKPFIWKWIFGNGLIYVHQLYQNGMLISARDANLQFGLTIMEFNALISATPRRLRKQLNQVQPRQSLIWQHTKHIYHDLIIIIIIIINLFSIPLYMCYE